MLVEDVYKSLQGQRLVIPDLRPVYSNWKTAVNVHYPKLVTEINIYLDKWITDEALRTAYRKADLAFLPSSMYPDCEWDRLKTMGLFTAAVFVMDDSIDKEFSGDEDDYAADYVAADELRKDCVAFMRGQLRQSTMRPFEPTPAPKEIAGFSEVAKLLLKSDPRQVQLPMLAKDLEDFIEGTAPEQAFKLGGTLPTVEEYWSFRHFVGCVLCYSTLHQYVADTKLPMELAWSEEVMAMRTETSFQPCVCNDLFSLKKEICERSVTNLIPIMMAHSQKSLDDVMSELIGQLYASAERFDTAAAALRAKGKRYDSAIQSQLERFIQTFETFQTGCFTFYVRSRRFKILDYKKEDESFEIPL
ncbi:terpene cyclase [Neopestalotiopsis sp. 37M]|nr:terpene cyclase [Neopestalotiopsis sp. 37M]